MVPSEIQIDKATAVFVNLMESYGDVAPTNVTKFAKALKKEIADAGDIPLIGRFREPDDVLGRAMKRANLPTGAISDVIMVSFERNDKVLYWLDGGWHEQSLAG